MRKIRGGAIVNARAKFNRRGDPKYDYRGAHVVDRYGRLAAIVCVYRNEDETPVAQLQRFNGEDAGEQPLALLNILERA